MKNTKPIVYTTATLMLIALGWGVIDFAKAERTGKLKNLYKDEAAKPVVAIAPSKKEVEFEDFSRGKIEEDIAPTEKKAVKKDRNETKEIKPALADFKLSVPKFNKRLSYKSFSRGALVMPPQDTLITFPKDSLIFKPDTLTGKSEDNK